ncbi:hypothetical protein [Streptomyces sp. NPDC051561]|uniref:hypothetical protein n=1 Tax=Streptomyces sp. NPDC051561 TaxID=3365658 RepID=UPI00379C374D
MDSAEAMAWAETLVRHKLLHAALPTPSGQWLVQHRSGGPVRVLSGPTALVELAAQIQGLVRTEAVRAR